MKKSTIAAILLTALWSHGLQGQSSTTGNAAKSYVGDINKMFPAAPTSNNLMKFEEVPVSYYTGIPDINIPLFNIPTNNSKVSVDIQLKYHPLNAKPDDKAGETGLGWSMIAGGTISRTIRGGGVDEKNRTIAFSTPPRPKFGIYNHIYNPTYKLLNDEPVNMDDYTFSAGSGRYDTEYDLFQYNFMGQSGRFYIVKDAAGNYKAEKLDRNNLQIRFDQDSTGEVTSFTMVDDKGIKYIFSPMEKSQKSITSTKTGLTTGIGNINENSEIGDYWASFHLTKITDQNNVALAVFKYDLASLVKFQEPTTRTTRIAKNVSYTNTSQSTSGVFQNPDANMPGATESETVYNTTNTKLLTSIEIVDKGIISLTYEKGRQDSNYTQPSELYKIKSVQSSYLGQSPGSYVEKYIFDYGYKETTLQHGQTTVLKKLVLNKVTKTSPNNQNQEYTLEYNNLSGPFIKDNWGYYKGNSSDIKNDVLKSITYPTKGKVVFDFGPNDYSHYYSGGGGSMASIQGYWAKQEKDFFIQFESFGNTKQNFFTVNSPQTVKLNCMLGNLIYYNYVFKIYKKVGENNFVQIYERGDGNQTCNTPQPDLCERSTIYPDGVIISDFVVDLAVEPGTYYASLTGSYFPSIPGDLTDTFSVTTNEDIFVNEVKRNGGGLRINNIQYFDAPNSTKPSKEFVYDYRDIDNPQKSSGSLVFPEPILSYSDSYSYRNKLNNADVIYNANFDVKTDYNILPVQKTQGSDVGYQYVTVRQFARDNNNNFSGDLGRTVYKFRSPLDNPNEGSLSLQPPIRPISNLDYLRGQLIFEKKYDSTGKIISETNTNYAVSEFEKSDGVKLTDNFYRNSVGEYFMYDSYQELFLHVGAVQLATPSKNFEKFGITLPTKKTETSYFYKNGVQSSVTTTTDNTYNVNDYPSISTQVFPGERSTVTSYQYATEKNNQKLINANMIGTPLETKVMEKKSAVDPGKITSKSEITYNYPTGILPDAVTILNTQSNVMENAVKYDKYDAKGNLLQYTVQNGVSTVIIWGYNNTQPIAKIENAKLSDIQQSYITPIVDASNLDATAGKNNDETNLLEAFRVFKSNLTNYQITTYSYDPLIGVRSITPPSGIREVYIYDESNRLKEIRENSQTGKVLKEFNYHYKN